MQAKKYLIDYPELVAQVHPTLNGDLDITKLTYGSNKQIHWICLCGFSWPAKVKNRTISATSCPNCSKKTRKNICLAISHPELCEEWDCNLNDKTPYDITAGSAEKPIWRCKKCKQNWSAAIYSRTRGCGCPYCKKQKVCIASSLATLAPGIAEEWDTIKNGELSPDDVTLN